jgi:hypothetical protein
LLPISKGNCNAGDFEFLARKFGAWFFSRRARHRNFTIFNAAAVTACISSKNTSALSSFTV